MKVLLISPLDPEVHAQNIEFNENFPVGSVLQARLPEENNPLLHKERYAPIFYVSTEKKDDFIIYKRESHHFKILI